MHRRVWPDAQGLACTCEESSLSSLAIGPRHCKVSFLPYTKASLHTDICDSQKATKHRPPPLRPPRRRASAIDALTVLALCSRRLSGPIERQFARWGHCSGHTPVLSLAVHGMSALAIGSLDNDHEAPTLDQTLHPETLSLTVGLSSASRKACIILC
ncbi:hypothetical protein PSPO01_02595 [Paraphaeosphaeria sporulosa]